MKELSVVLHIKINDEDYLWDTLTKEQQREIGIAINDRSLRTLGYDIKKREA